jgi:hypothetical protein
MGTSDGLAKAAYIRESRRIVAQTTISEHHLGRQFRQQLYGQSPEAQQAEQFSDSVGVGSYPIDLHPTSAGDNYIDFETWPFQIPLGALLPIRLRNLLPASKNIGTTHLTSGCYRLHPVEWGIGEAVGHLVGYCIKSKVQPVAVREPDRLEAFQKMLQQQGVQIRWAGA